MTMHVLQAVFVFFLVLPSTILAQDDCFTNLRDLMAAMEAKQPFDFQTFVVCPNTVIEIGDRNPNDVNDYINGDVPLTMRQFSRVYCGKEGSLSDNCTIKGGIHQVRVDGSTYNGEDKKSMEIKGFTFEESDQSAIIAVVRTGDLKFENCLFRKHMTSILTALTAEQSDPEITFDNCIFDSNDISGAAASVVAGPITVTSVKLTITNSVFSNNTFASDGVRTSYLISADDDSVVTLQNNCFFENDLQNLGVVNLSSQSAVGEISNNFGAKDDEGLTCHFVHFVGGECQEFDLDTCPLPGVVAPPVRSAVNRPAVLVTVAAIALAYLL